MKKYSFIFLATFLIFFFIGLTTVEGNDIHSVITYNIKYDDLVILTGFQWILQFEIW